jgi:diguanylate cyclase (GGDEF)-like protein
VDVEGLDSINQAHGYATGDDVVGYVGHALSEAVAPRGHAGRVGGGVFLIVWEGVDGEEAETNARMLVERITRGAPGHLPTIGLTIGVSSFPAQAAGPDDLVRSARLALYAAKKNGPNSVAVARIRDDRWMHDAHAAFVRVVSAQQLPAMRRG